MITTENMLYLENLVKVRLDAETRENYRLQMGSILDYIQEITSLGLGDVKPDHTHKNIYKNDIVDQDPDHIKRALENAPDKIGNLYKVAQVIKQ